MPVRSAERIAVALGLAILAASALTLFPRARFDDGCDFGGDVWEYQSVAVNFAAGRGFPLLGGLEPFERYRFGGGQELRDPALLAQFTALGDGTPDFFRPPGYPFFLGAVYRIGGVSPRRAKQVQLALLVVAAAALPLIGALSWGRRGALAGALAGPSFLALHAAKAGRLLSENLLAFWVVLLALALLLWSRRATPATTALAGLVAGTGLLIKGWFYPLVPLLLGLALLRVRRRALPARHAAAFALLLLAPALLWSLHATARSGTRVFICTQGPDVVLAGNNERSLGTGGWHPEWAEAPDAFYLRPDIRRRPWPVQVLLFSAEHAAEVPAMLRRKVGLGFHNRVFALLAAMFFCAGLVGSLGSRLGARLGPAAASGALARFARGALATGTVLAVLDIMGGWLWSGSVLDERTLLLAAATLAAVSLATGGGLSTRLPAALGLVFLNALLVTLVFYGSDRFTWPADPLFALAAWEGGLALITSAGRAFLPGAPERG